MLSEFLEEKRSKSKGKTIIEVFANIEKEMPESKSRDLSGKPEIEKHRKVKITLNAEKDVDLKEKNEKIDKLIKSKGVEYPQHFIWLDGAEDTEGIIEFPKTRVKRVYVLKGDYDNPTFMYIPQYNPDVKMSKPYYEITDTSILVHMDGFSGSGTVADPYLINNYTDLANCLAQSYSTNWYLVTADIDCGGATLAPAGAIGPGGGFDGGNFWISNLNLTKPLFTSIRGTFRNVKLDVAASSAGIISGSLAGSGKVSNIYVTGSYVSTGSTGAILGNVIDNAVFENSIIENMTMTGAMYAGAVFEITHFGVIQNVHLKNITITTTGFYVAGFIYFARNGTIRDCTVDNITITGPQHGTVAGFVYYASKYTSGFTYLQRCTVSNSTLGNSLIREVGGFAANIGEYLVSDCAAINVETITKSSPLGHGGFASVLGTATSIVDCFVTSGGMTNGVNAFAPKVGTITTSYFDAQAAGFTESNYGGTAVSTTAAMKKRATYTGFNIVQVADANTRNTSYTWNIVENTTFPFLSSSPIPPPQFFSAITIDGSYITGCTIDNTPVTKITMDGITVYEA